MLTSGEVATDGTFVTGSTAGVWTAWKTLLTLPAITAEQAGNVLLDAEAMGSVTTPVSSGGGDRLFAEARLRRTRGSTTTDLELAEIYIRNVNVGGDAAAFTLAARNFSMAMAYMDAAQAGDVYSVEWRLISQEPSRTVAMQHTITRLQMASW